MNTKMKQFSRTGTDFLKVYVYRATKWNMKEIGEINNRHKSQSTEGINFHRQQEKRKGKKNPKPPLLKNNSLKYFSCASNQFTLNRTAFICVYGIEIAL